MDQNKKAQDETAGCASMTTKYRKKQTWLWISAEIFLERVGIFLGECKLHRVSALWVIEAWIIKSRHILLYISTPLKLPERIEGYPDIDVSVLVLRTWNITNIFIHDFFGVSERRIRVSFERLVDLY